MASFLGMPQAKYRVKKRYKVFLDGVHTWKTLLLPVILASF